jgi:hypothetical protein
MTVSYLQKRRPAGHQRDQPVFLCTATEGVLPRRFLYRITVRLATRLGRG